MADASPIEQSKSGSPKGAKEAAEQLKQAVLQLILNDKDIEQALRLTLGLPIGTDEAPGKLGGSDAEQAAIVQDLIEQSIMRMVRPDAMRRPVPVH